jgi:type III restriction enzyme
MKLQLRHRKFQADAAKAVCDVFTGQPHSTPSYMIDRGNMGNYQMTLTDEQDFTGFGNARIVPELNEGIILENIRKIQRGFQIEPSKSLEGRYNLTVEMETGVGKTYTCIKTMYELKSGMGGANSSSSCQASPFVRACISRFR